MDVSFRIEIWSAKSELLEKKFRQYEDAYREKVYSRLTDDEKKKRNYRVIGGKAYCDYIIKSRTHFFKKEINELVTELIEINSESRIGQDFQSLGQHISYLQ